MLRLFLRSLASYEMNYLRRRDDRILQLDHLSSRDVRVARCTSRSLMVWSGGGVRWPCGVVKGGLGGTEVRETEGILRSTRTGRVSRTNMWHVLTSMKWKSGWRRYTAGAARGGRGRLDAEISENAGEYLPYSGENAASSKWRTNYAADRIINIIVAEMSAYDYTKWILSRFLNCSFLI